MYRRKKASIEEKTRSDTLIIRFNTFDKLFFARFDFLVDASRWSSRPRDRTTRTAVLFLNDPIYKKIYVYTI